MFIWINTADGRIFVNTQHIQAVYPNGNGSLVQVDGNETDIVSVDSAENLATKITKATAK